MEGQDKLQETGLESQLASCFSSSCKSLVFPSRPSYGKLGTKCVVKANYFLADISVSDLSHYHVSHLETSKSCKIVVIIFGFSRGCTNRNYSCRLQFRN
jgi:hypothetical protein